MHDKNIITRIKAEDIKGQPRTQEWGGYEFEARVFGAPTNFPLIHGMGANGPWLVC